MSIEVFNESGYSYTPSEREAEVWRIPPMWA